jgi:oligopeptide/dipeptide ABC transporter ATP-binding protein
MYLGRIVELAETAALFAAPRHPYSQALLAAVPVPDPASRKQRRLLEGDVPSPIDPPPGCRLHTRCAHVRERCRVETPPLAADSTEHATACHYWRDFAPPPQAAAAAAENPALAKLQAAFAAARGSQPD